MSPRCPPQGCHVVWRRESTVDLERLTMDQHVTAAPDRGYGHYLHTPLPLSPAAQRRYLLGQLAGAVVQGLVYGTVAAVVLVALLLLAAIVG